MRDCPELDSDDDRNIITYSPEYFDIDEIQEFEGLTYIPVRGCVRVEIDYEPTNDSSYDNSSTEWHILDNSIEIDWKVMIEFIACDNDEIKFKTFTAIERFDREALNEIHEKIDPEIQKIVDDWTPLD